MYTNVSKQLAPTLCLIVSLQIVNISSESVFSLVSLLESILAVQPSSAKDNPFTNYLYLRHRTFMRKTGIVQVSSIVVDQDVLPPGGVQWARNAFLLQKSLPHVSHRIIRGCFSL